MESMIRVENLTKSYQHSAGTVPVLRGVTCEFSQGSCSFILGPSGSGKSTLLYLLGALDSGDQGEILVEGRRLSEMTTSQRNAYRLRDVGFIFQSFNLLKNLDALGNTLVPFLPGGCTSEMRHRAGVLLDRVGLKNRWYHRPSQLSGGEQQRVAIARAILKNPKVILADEPTGELDGETGDLIFSLLRQLQSEEGATVITVTHDDRFLKPTDQILRMQDGKISEAPVVAT